MHETLGHYQILRELGRGAMGVVYLAFDPHIARHVAIKTILLHAGERNQLRDALMREARAAGQLSHPNIVTVHQVGEEGDLLYLVMEHVAGGSLDDRLVPDQPSEFSWACKLLRQVAAALDAAHTARIVHRDVKPSNILLAGTADLAKVADFGIARTFISGHSHTQPAGTPFYMSPEQINGRPLDGRSDQFALAVLAYRLLTGKLPFRAENFVALALQITTAEPPPAHEANAALSPAVSDVLARGLNKQREGRYPTCTDLVDALEAAPHQAVARGMVPPLEKWLTRAMSGVTPWVLLVVALFSSLGGYLYWRGTKVPPRQARRTVSTEQPIAPTQAKPSGVEPGEAPAEPLPPQGVETVRRPEVSKPRHPTQSEPESGADEEEPGADIRRSQESQVATHNLVDAIQRREGTPVLLSLLNRRANPSAGLFEAMRTCNEEAARLLLSRGADPNWMHPSWRMTPLGAAIPRQSTDTCTAREAMIDLLLAHGARPDGSVEGDSPVSKAASLGPAGLPLLKKLLAARAPTQGGLLNAAAARYPLERDCDTSSVEALLFRGAKPDAEADRYGKTPLMEAASNKCEAMVALFLKHGAQVDRADNEGRTALYYIVKDGDLAGPRPAVPVVKRLLQAGANPNRECARAAGGDTPLLCACKGGELALMEMLLDAGGDPDRTNNRGETCLHLAISWNGQSRVRNLLARKVNVNARDEHGRTPLGEARRLGMKDTDPIVRLLLRANATE